MVDTGASLNCLSLNLFHNLPQSIKNTLQCTNKKCRLANDHVIPMWGSIKLSVKFNGQAFTSEYYVMSNLPVPILFGLPFLRQHKATITFDQNNKMVISLQQPLTLQKDFILPPYAEGISLCSLPTNQNTNYLTSTGECGPLPSNDINGLMIAHTAVTIQDNQVPVRIYNSTDKSLWLKKGRKIAIFQPWTSDVEVLNFMDSKEIVKQNKTGQFVPDVDLSSPILDNKKKETLKQLVTEFSDCFVNPADNQLGLTRHMKHKINLKADAKPLHKMPYRVAPDKRQAMENIVQEQLSQNIIEPTYDGAWASPALLVRKGPKGYRMVIDFRHLNSCTIPVNLRIPRLDDIFDSVGHNRPQIFSLMDISNAFHQLTLDESSRDYTAFLTSSGKYRYKTMPQGLRNAAASFQALVDVMLKGIQNQYILAYIDDLLVFSKDFSTHITHLKELFQRLRNTGLKLKPAKCHFAVEKVQFLGHILTKDGIAPNTSKVDAIMSYPIPKKIKELRGFLGTTGFYRKFIQNYSLIAKPLYNLTKNDVKFQWSPECQTAFDKLKNALASYPVLMYPNFNERFVLATDGSKTAIAGCLSQRDSEGNLKPIAYAGRALTPAEQNYTTTEWELLAIVWSVQHFRVYLEHNEFDLYTDHSALQSLLKEKQLSGRLARWCLCIQSFRYKVHHIKGKLNIVPDTLSRRSYDYTRTDADDVLDDFPSDDYPADNICNVIIKSKTPSYTETFIFPDDPHPLVKFVNRQLELPGILTFPDNYTPKIAEFRYKMLFRELECKAMSLLHNLEVDTQLLQNHQISDPICHKIISFLQVGELPSDEDDAEHILIIQRNYVLFNGILFYFSAHNPYAEFNIAIFVPWSLQPAVIEFFINDESYSIQSITDLYEIIENKFYWTNMYQDIANYYSTILETHCIADETQKAMNDLTQQQGDQEIIHDVSSDILGLNYVTDNISFPEIHYNLSDFTKKSTTIKFNDTVQIKYFEPENMVIPKPITLNTPGKSILKITPSINLINTAHRIPIKLEQSIFPQDHDKLVQDHNDQDNSLPTDLIAPISQDVRNKQRKDKLIIPLRKSTTIPLSDLNLEPKTIKEEQLKDPQCRILISYLKHGKLPNNNSKARNVLLREEDYILIDDILYHINMSKHNLAYAALVVPRSLRYIVLNSHHDSPHAGHVSVQKMLSTIKNKYFWIGLNTDVIQYAQSCTKCLSSKSTPHINKPPLTLRDQAPAPFHTLFWDTVGPLPVSKSKNCHLVCVTDLCTKYVIAWPTQDITATTLAKQFHDKVICQFGCPSVLISDNGKSFTSKFMEALAKSFNIKQIFNTFYKPSSSGQCERMNRSLIQSLRNYVSKNQTDWDEHLPGITFALNTTESYSTGHSPYFLLYGRTPVYPSEISLPNPLHLPRSVKQHLADMLQTQRDAQKLASDHLIKKQKDMKDYYDKNAHETNLAPGDIVYIYHPKLQTRKTKKKLQSSWFGPYVIVKFHKNTSAFVRRMSDGKYLEKSVALYRLKRGHIRQNTKLWKNLTINNLDPDEDLVAEDILDDNSIPQEGNAENLPNPIPPQNRNDHPTNDNRIQNQPNTNNAINSRNKSKIKKKTKANTQEFFSIEKVLGKKKVNGVYQYLIKWKDYSSKFNSFEPWENLNNHARKFIESHTIPEI